MAEQISNFKEVEQFIVPTKDLEQVKSEEKIVQPKSNFDEIKEFVITDTQTDTTKEPPKTIETVSSLEGEPSWWRKFTYGFDKQDQFFGNIFRISKAAIQDINDDTRNLKEVLRDNAGIENQKLLNKFTRFRGGKYDNDIYTKAGEMASLLLDPFYLLAYLTPWGRAATASYKGLALVGGTTVGLDKLVSDFTKTGEFKPTDAAIAAGSAAVLGPAGVKAFRVISKYFPGADKKKLADVIKASEGASAQKLGVSKSVYDGYQKILADKEIISLSNAIRTTETNYSKNYKTIKLPFNKKKETLNKTINELTKANKENFTKKTANKITKLESKRAELIKAFKVEKKEFFKSQNKLLEKNLKLQEQRSVKLLEKFRQNQSLDEAAIKFVLNATTRPLFGAGIGYAFGTLWGSEDDDLNKWIIGGAALGGLQKGVQASKILKVGDKNLATNLIKNEAVKLTLQKLRELTSTTAATKLEAFGGRTEQLGKMLLQNVDSPYSKNSVSKISDEIQRNWTSRAVNIFKGFSNDEGKNVLDSLRGSTIKLTTKEKRLKSNVQKYLDDFKVLINDSGIFAKQNIKNYFPRVYDFGKIQRNPKEFEKVLTEVFKNKGSKNASKKAKDFAEKLNDISNLNLLKGNVQDFVNDKKLKDTFIVTPLSNHINKQRILTGKYKDVEKVLSDNGYLINNPAQVLSSLVNRSANSIAFAQRFGPNGQLLKGFYQSIKDKYKNTGKTNWRELAEHEIKIVNNTIEAYFDRFGVQRQNQLKMLSGTFATISNLNMLDRVTIASLGDIVQPFTNSTNWSTWLRALTQTSLTAAGERGAAKNLAQAQTNEIRTALLKPLAVKGDEMTAHASWLGSGGAMSKINNAFFTISGLQWLTGFARRFAYNAGATDAYLTSRKFANFVSRGGSSSSAKYANFVRDLDRYGITVNDALKIGSEKSFSNAIKKKVGKINLNDAGIAAANRDAIIPQVSNRLLFTQSNTPWVRLMGQFLSWTMAKSAQTNKILQRIENGDARTMVKLLAAIPVYGGIQELRELAKYGEVITDIDADTNEWWAESFRLSGLPGVLPEFLANTFVGPGSRQPFFLAFPAGSIAFEIDKITKDYLKGNTERANERFFQRIAPLPNWRRFVIERLKDVGVDFDDGTTKLPETKLERRQFNQGDEVLEDEKTKGENKDMNIKDTAKAAVVAGAMTIPTFAEGVPQKYPSDAGGVIIEEANKIERLENEMAKAEENFILPKRKPKVIVKEKTIDYSKLPDLSKEKNKGMFDIATVIYTNNKKNAVPDDVLIAMALEESGYGTGRFYKQGNNFFNMIAEEGDKRIKAKGDETVVAKFDTPSQNIDKFYSWVDNKGHYENVRKTIKLYNEGKANKSDIIDAIQATGWAENPEWASNVKSILNKRVNGKHKNQLKDLSDSLFNE